MKIKKLLIIPLIIFFACASSVYAGSISTSLEIRYHFEKDTGKKWIDATDEEQQNYIQQYSEISANQRQAKQDAQQARQNSKSEAMNSLRAKRQAQQERLNDRKQKEEAKRQAIEAKKEAARQKLEEAKQKMQEMRARTRTR